MNEIPLLIHPVKTPRDARVAPRHMIAVVRKLLAGAEPGALAHNLVAFNDHAGAVDLQQDPFAAEQGDHSVRSVVNRDKVNKRMRLIRRKSHSAMMVVEFIEPGREAGQFP